MEGAAVGVLHLKQTNRLWKLLNPQLVQSQSPGLCLFFETGSGDSRSDDSCSICELDECMSRSVPFKFLFDSAKHLRAMA